MADSAALRSQRYRLHRAGNHSLCRRCGGDGARLAVAQPGPAADPCVVDPAAEMTLLAARLAAAYAADPGNAQLARELRMTLGALKGGGGADDGLAELLGRLSG